MGWRRQEDHKAEGREAELTKSLQDVKSAKNEAEALQTSKPAESSKTKHFELHVPKAASLSSPVAQPHLTVFWVYRLHSCDAVRYGAI